VIRVLKNIFWKGFTSIDAQLKFPNLKKGEIGIQLGFDMTAPITSDLFSLHKKAAPNGLVIGIDPDPFNHQIAQPIINKNKYNIQLIQKGTYSKKDTTKFLVGEKSSWNQLKDVPKDSTVNFTDREIEVEIDKLDTIIGNLNFDFQKISHINLTINGAEYDTLLGMEKMLSEIENLSLTIIAGRYDESGTINGKKDYEMILPLLHSYGFTTQFKRIHQLFWWGFVVKFCLNRKWFFNQPNFGVIIACKGKHRVKWYQSFS
jgi:FkbM family methyltransferase